jgi:hypothetical protein
MIPAKIFPPLYSCQYILANLFQPKYSSQKNPAKLRPLNCFCQNSKIFPPNYACQNIPAKIFPPKYPTNISNQLIPAKLFKPKYSSQNIPAKIFPDIIPAKIFPHIIPAQRNFCQKNPAKKSCQIVSAKPAKYYQQIMPAK